MIVSLVIAAIVVVAAGGVYTWLVENPHQSVRKPPQKTARLVEVMPVEVGDYAVTVSAMGEAKAARQISLRPQVAGRVAAVSPRLIPGGRFAAGDKLVDLDPADLTFTLRERESEVQQAESDIMAAQATSLQMQRELAVERGNQNVAKREFELLGDDIPEDDRALILRQPQLLAAQADAESAEAAVAAARAALSAAENRRDQAQMDVDRVAVTAPFNAVVAEQLVDVGDVVTTATSLATLVGTDRAWVELGVAVSDLRWIEVPDDDRPGSTVQLYQTAAWGEGVARTGRVIQRMPQLDTVGRTARVLVELDDPLGLQDGSDGERPPALMMGSYVQAVVTGPTLTGVVRLPRSVVWDGDTVRLINDQNELELRPVTVVYREAEHVLISDGLGPGDRVVTTDLGLAVDGMALRTETSKPAKPAKPAADAGDGTGETP